MDYIQNIYKVIRREIALWRKRPVYMIGAIVPLAFCTVFFMTLFGVGMPSKLPIGVVDYDQSSLTRNFIRQLDATQLGSVIEYPSFSEARADMQKGTITSICVLPEGMNRDVQSQRQPTFTFYVNGLYFVSGSLAYKDILMMINLTSGAVHRTVLRAKGVNDHTIQGILRPVNIDVHQIGNPTTDYGAYLMNGILPAVLAMSVILILVYSIGTEMKYGSSRHLLKVAGGSMAVALGGKMLLYTLLFCMLGWGMVGILFLFLHFPYAGSLVWMFLDVFLLVVASECVAIFIIGLLPVCRFALSVSALYSVLAFSFTGFSLPVESMLPQLQGFAAMFPVRHYFQMYVQEALFASGFAGAWIEIIHLLLFLFLPVLVVRRLERAFIKMDYPKD